MAPPDGQAGRCGAFRLGFPHGFVDEHGGHRFWRAGQLVDDADEIALLRERGADLQEM